MGLIGYVFQTVSLNAPIDMSAVASFWIGASVVETDGFPAPMDQSDPLFHA